MFSLKDETESEINGDLMATQIKEIYDKRSKAHRIDGPGAYQRMALLLSE